MVMYGIKIVIAAIGCIVCLWFLYMYMSRYFRVVEEQKVDSLQATCNGRCVVLY